MATIKFTKSHALMLQTLPEGRYKAKIAKIKEEISKSNKNNTNTVFTFEITDHEDYTGKTVDLFCPNNHKFGVAKMLQIHCAVIGQSLDDFDDYDEDYNPESDLGAPVVIEIGHRLFNGNKTEEVKVVLPADTPTDTPF